MQAAIDDFEDNSDSEANWDDTRIIEILTWDTEDSDWEGYYFFDNVEPNTYFIIGTTAIDTTAETTGKAQVFEMACQDDTTEEWTLYDECDTLPPFVWADLAAMEASDTWGDLDDNQPYDDAETPEESAAAGTVALPADLDLDDSV